MHERPTRLFDLSGLVPRAVEVDEWSATTLHEQLTAAWDTPHHLGRLLELALRAGVAAQVVSAADRLMELTPADAEAAVLRAAVRLALGETKRAKTLLEHNLLQFGRRAPVVLALAKALAASQDGASSTARGNADVIRLVRESLRIDPNLDAAVHWYAALRMRVGGEPAWFSALEELTQDPACHVAPLLLGRAHILQHRSTLALDPLKQAIARSHAAPAVVHAICAALQRPELAALLVAALGPAFDPERHDPADGVALARALFQCGDVARAHALHRRLTGRVPRVLEAELATLGGALAARTRRVDVPRPDDIKGVPVLGPIWAAPLAPARKLIADRSGRPRVVLFALSDETHGEDDESGRALLPGAPESETSRLARAIPLHLADVVRATFLVETVSVVPVVLGEGIFTATRPWDVALALLMSPHTSDNRVLVMGSLSTGGRQAEWSLQLDLFDLHAKRHADRTRVLGGNVTSLVQKAAVGLVDAMHRLSPALSPALSPSRDVGSARQEHGPRAVASDEWVDEQWLAALADLQALFLVASGAIADTQLWNHASMVRRMVQVARLSHHDHPSRLLALAGVACCASMGIHLPHDVTDWVTATLEQQEQASAQHAEVCRHVRHLLARLASPTKQA